MTSPIFERYHVLVVPGWQNSGPEHWQSRWQDAHPAWQRVQQADWLTPSRADWVATLDAAVRAGLDWQRANVPARFASPRAGTLFRRDLVFDGHELADGRVATAMRMGDLHWNAEPPTVLGRVVTEQGEIDDTAWMVRCAAVRDALLVRPLLDCLPGGADGAEDPARHREALDRRLC